MTKFYRIEGISHILLTAKTNLESTLNCVQESDTHLVFPIVYETIQIRELLPSMAVAVERCFSRPKSVKHKLRSLFRQKTLQSARQSVYYCLRTVFISLFLDLCFYLYIYIYIYIYIIRLIR